MVAHPKVTLILVYSFKLFDPYTSEKSLSTEVRKTYGCTDVRMDRRSPNYKLKMELNRGLLSVDRHLWHKLLWATSGMVERGGGARGPALAPPTHTRVKVGGGLSPTTFSEANSSVNSIASVERKEHLLLHNFWDRISLPTYFCGDSYPTDFLGAGKD